MNKDNQVWQALLKKIRFEEAAKGVCIVECMLKSCIRCRGDLVLDDGDWKCIQCARYIYGDHGNILAYFGPPVLDGFVLPKIEAHQIPDDDEFASATVFSSPFFGGPELKARKTSRRRRSAYGSRAARNINSYIQAKSKGEDRWWDRNRQIVEYLDQGLSVQEISVLTERGPRQVRTVRERLADLRATA